MEQQQPRKSQPVQASGKTPPRAGLSALRAPTDKTYHSRRGPYGTPEAFLSTQKHRPLAARHWFEVDKQGLARILERRGKEFALFELIQNAWDERGVTQVNVTLEYLGRNKALLVVEDDAPEGFKNLNHAFTLFADSAKKANPEQRGRFNLGEKLVLAISEQVTIRTANGGIRLDHSGRHILRPPTRGQPR